MSEAAQRLEETLVMLVLYQSTGALEVSADKKRWYFYLDSGALIGTKSNLKSESEESLRRSLGELSEPEMAQVQAARRIANAAKAEDATWAFQDGVAPARATPSDVRRALFEGVREARDEDTLREILTPLMRGFPIAREYQLLGTGTMLDHYLANLDGSRPAEDVIDFAPVEPHAVLAGLWLALRLEVLGTGTADDADVPTDLFPPEDGAVPSEGAAEDAEVAEAPPEQHPPAAPTAPAAPPPWTPTPVFTQAHEVDLRTLRAAEPAAPPPPQPQEDHPMAPVLSAIEARFKTANNHFELLGEPWNRPLDGLRAAYMRLARDLHPDRYSGASPELRDRATELFDKVRAAWEVLGEDDARKAYIDRVIHGKKSEEEEAMEQVQLYLAAESDFKRGLAAFNAGQVTQALPLFKTAVDRAPEEVEFRAYLGYTLFFTNFSKDPVSAEMGLKMLQDAVDRNAGQERKRDALWVLLARAWREKGDNHQARKAAIGALKINPSNPDAVRLLRRMEDEETAATKASKNMFAKMQDWFTSLFKKKGE